MNVDHLVHTQEVFRLLLHSLLLCSIASVADPSGSQEVYHITEHKIAPR